MDSVKKRIYHYVFVYGFRPTDNDIADFEKLSLATKSEYISSQDDDYSYLLKIAVVGNGQKLIGNQFGISIVTPAPLSFILLKQKIKPIFIFNLSGNFTNEAEEIYYSWYKLSLLKKNANKLRIESDEFVQDYNIEFSDQQITFANLNWSLILQSIDDALNKSLQEMREFARNHQINLITK